MCLVSIGKRYLGCGHIEPCLKVLARCAPATNLGLFHCDRECHKPIITVEKVDGHVDYPAVADNPHTRGPPYCKFCQKMGQVGYDSTAPNRPFRPTNKTLSRHWVAMMTKFCESLKSWSHIKRMVRGDDGLVIFEAILKTIWLIDDVISQTCLFDQTQQSRIARCTYLSLAKSGQFDTEMDIFKIFPCGGSDDCPFSPGCIGFQPQPSVSNGDRYETIAAETTIFARDQANPWDNHEERLTAALFAAPMPSNNMDLVLRWHWLACQQDGHSLAGIEHVLTTYVALFTSGAPPPGGLADVIRAATDRCSLEWVRGQRLMPNEGLWI